MSHLPSALATHRPDRAHLPIVLAYSRDVLSAGMTLGVGSRSGGRKPRFSKEQQASIMESVERNFRLHPSRWVDANWAAAA